MTEDERRAALGSCLHKGLRVVGASRATRLAYAVIDLTLDSAWTRYLDAVLTALPTMGLEGALRYTIRESLPYTNAANSALRQTLDLFSREDWATLAAYATNWEASPVRTGADDE